jgi:AcrR family transcriptional regulator
MNTAGVNTAEMSAVMMKTATMDDVTTSSTKSTANATTSGDVKRLSARERLLEAAHELFYEEGVHTVGIDRVIERAGVAKASLYSTFGSKDELIRAYLIGWAENRQERITRNLAGIESPRERVFKIFELLHETTSRPTYHGCAFMNASAEAPAGSPIVEAADDYRGWMRSTFVGLSRELGAPDPERLGRYLHLLYDGASVSARMDHDPNAAAAAREMAVTLIDAAVGSVR